MTENVVLTPERILEVTEDVLRRFGLAKATLVGVARALDVSHGSVYRHFPSKESLREAVANPLLGRASAPQPLTSPRSCRGMERCTARSADGGRAGVVAQGPGSAA